MSEEQNKGNFVRHFLNPPIYIDLNMSGFLRQRLDRTKSTKQKRIVGGRVTFGTYNSQGHELMPAKINRLVHDTAVKMAEGVNPPKNVETNQKDILSALTKSFATLGRRGV